MKEVNMKKFALFKESIEAQEIYAQYKSNLEDGKNNEDAYNDLYSYYQDAIEDEYSLESILFWIVVALFQWEYGIVDEMIKEKAIDIIDQNKIKLLGDEYIYISDLAAIEKDFIEIKELLLSDNLKYKKIKQKMRYVDPWLKGDVFIYKIDLHSITPLVIGENNLEKDKYGIDGKYIALQKIQNVQSCSRNSVPCLAIYNWISDEKPSDLSIFKDIGFIELLYDSPDNIVYLLDIEVSSGEEFTDMGIEYIGHIPLKEELSLDSDDDNTYHIYVNSINTISVRLYVSLYVNTEKHMSRYNPRFQRDIKNGQIYSKLPKKYF